MDGAFAKQALCSYLSEQYNEAPKMIANGTHSGATYEG